MNPEQFKLIRPQAKVRGGKADWYSIKAQADGGTEVLIYDEIGYFGVTASDFARDLQGMDTDSITVRLNTPGGEVFDGIAIFNTLKSHKAYVTVVIDSLAASIGSVIAMAGDKVVVGKHAQIMIHDAMAGALGNSAGLRELADLLDKTSNNIASIYSDRAGDTPEEWRKKMRAETWFSADEAVEVGLADEVQSFDTTQKSSWDLSIYNYRCRDEAPASEVVEAPSFEWDPDVFRRALKEASA